MNENSLAEAGYDEFGDWAGSPLSTLHEPDCGPEPIRTEEFFRHGRFVVRFVLPDVNPAHIEVTIEPRMLTVAARRRVGHDLQAYHLCTSHVCLPPETDDTNATAVYGDGALEVTVGLGSQRPPRTLAVLTQAPSPQLAGHK